MLLVFGLAHGEGGWTQSRLLLTGVIVAAGCGAVVTLMLAIAPEDRLRGMLFWLMGDLSQTGDPQLVLILLVAVLLIALPFARELNLLARGADVAQALGVAVRPLRRGVYLVASLATAAAVTHAGAIGFIGLIVPHLVRLATGNDQRLLLPASVLAGGSLLVIADTLARTVLAPQQLPVGVLTALIGVPVFLFLLTRGAPGGDEMSCQRASPDDRGARVGIAGRSFCRDLELSVQPGESLAILGRNGAGKSTLLSVLAGLREPEAGEVRIAGASYAQLGARRSAQFAAGCRRAAAKLFPRRCWKRRWSDAIPISIAGTGSPRRCAQSPPGAGRVGLAELAQRDVQTLSGGERQRLAIATLLTQAPQLYLLDEPLAHLDLNHQIATLELFHVAQSRRGQWPA
jgi:ABC-type cobalamin/Fe3+-siderophores transport system ATPase subunit